MGTTVSERRTLRRRTDDNLFTMPPANDGSARARRDADSELSAIERKAASHLARSQEVKARFDACSDDLAHVNEVVRQEVAELSEMTATEQVLADRDAVKVKVKKCAFELGGVHQALVRAMQNLKETHAGMADALTALAITEAALAAAKNERKKAMLLALHDPTTGLPNRRLFDDRLNQSLSVAARHHWTLALLFVDLDRFKNINDQLGHSAGDEVLKAVARRLLTHTRGEDTACRCGGDEFLFLLMNPQGRNNVARIAESILKDTAIPLETGSADVTIRASIGIAMFPGDGATPKELITRADAAMYKAKRLRTGFEFA